MGSERFDIELQGVSADLMQANGSYDDVSFKNLSAQRIAEILAIISQLCPPDGDDVCPVNLIVHGPRGDQTFAVYDDSGQICSVDPDGYVTIEQAIMMITGRPADFAIPQPARPQTSVVAGVCPNCQTKVEPDESFCGGCGQAIVRHAPPPPPSSRKAVAKAPIDQQTYNDIVGLMGNPLSLREFRVKFPSLQKGPNGAEYREVIGAMCRADPPQDVRTRLKIPPRDWGIRKPGFFRRSLTALVDFPLILVLIVAVIRLGEKLPLDPDGAVAGILALSWIFLIAPTGFYTLFEVLLGATPGGLLVGLRVVDAYGNKPPPSLSVLRILGKIIWLIMLVLSIVTLRFQALRTPGHLIKLPSGESLQPIDDGEVVIN